MYLRNRVPHACVLLAAMAALTACAGRQHRAETPQAAAPAARPDTGHGYRFYMTQNGRKMTADDFDAWLKANGLRVQGGKVVKITGRDAQAGKAAGAKLAGRTGSGAKPSGATRADSRNPGGIAKADGQAKASDSAKANGTAHPRRIAKANGTANANGAAKTNGIARTRGTTTSGNTANTHGTAQAVAPAKAGGTPRVAEVDKAKAGDKRKKAAAPAETARKDG